MANPIAKILRRMTGAAGAPSNLGEGILAFNKTEDKLYFGTGATPEVIAGKGEFVDKSSEQTVTGKKNFTTATVSTAPSDANDIVRKTDLDAVASSVAALGSAFNYVGTIAGGTEASPTLLASLAQKDAGDYYKVTTAGHFKLGTAAAFYANIHDGLVFNNASGIDKIDNTDSTVAGTANEISVTGSTDTGYTVAIATQFKTRMTTAEGDIDSLETRMTTAEGDIDSVETRMTTAEGDIDDLETKTQNIDLLNTSANNTPFSGTIKAVGSDAYSTAVLSPTELSFGSGDVRIGAAGAALMGPLSVGSSGTGYAINLIASTFNLTSPVSDADITAPNLNLAGNLVGSGSNRTIENFVIDAGTF